MKRLLLLATLLLPLTVLAQSAGDTKDIDGQKFTYKGGTWVHDALNDGAVAEKSFSVVYRDKTWQKWYSEGSSTLKSILDLGPTVLFKYKDDKGVYHTYGVFDSKAALAAAAGGGSGGTATAGGAGGSGGGSAAGMATTTKVLIGAGALVAGAVIVDAAQDDNEDSATRR